MQFTKFLAEAAIECDSVDDAGEEKKLRDHTLVQASLAVETPGDAHD